MARKTKADAEKTRGRILDAALSVFSRKGFVRSTLRDIAREAGVTRGAVYWHFKDKVDLFVSLSDEVDHGTATSTDDLMRDTFRSLEDLREKLLIYLSNFDTNERFRTFYEFVTYKVEYHQELEPVLERQRRDKRLIMGHLEANYRTLQLSGKMRADIDAGLAAIMTAGFVHGIIDLWLFDTGFFSMQDTAPKLVDHFIQSLAPVTYECVQ